MTALGVTRQVFSLKHGSSTFSHIQPKGDFLASANQLLSSLRTRFANPCGGGEIFLHVPPPPSHLAAATPEELPALRTIALGGESFTLHAVKPWLSAGVQVFNTCKKLLDQMFITC